MSPTRRMPPSVRRRLLAIPDRERLGLPAGEPPRRLPSSVRTKILAIPTRERATPSLFRRLVVDGKLAVAASALLAVLLAPLVEAATPTSVAASRTMSSGLLELESASSSFFARSRSTLQALPRELSHHLDPALAAAHTQIATTGALIASSLESSVSALFGSNAAPLPIQPQGDPNVQPEP